MACTLAIVDNLADQNLVQSEIRYYPRHHRRTTTYLSHMMLHNSSHAQCVYAPSLVLRHQTKLSTNVNAAKKTKMFTDVQYDLLHSLIGYWNRDSHKARVSTVHAVLMPGAFRSIGDSRTTG